MKLLATLTMFGTLFFTAAVANAQSPSMRGGVDRIKAPANSATSREPASASRSYSCNASDDGLFSGMDPITMKISGSRLTVSYKDGDTEHSATGTLDHDYKPRAHAKQIRFNGLEALIDDSGSVVAIVNNNILVESTKKTWVKLQWTGESFDSSFYSCTLNR